MFKSGVKISSLEDRVITGHLAKHASRGLKISHKMMDEGRVKVALRMNEIAAMSNYFSKKNTPRCTSTLYRTEQARNRWLLRVSCSEKDSDPAGHMVRIKALPGKTSNLRDRDVLVTCSCKGFLFWGGMYNAQTKNYWEAIGPKVTGPTVMRHLKDRYMICKHIHVAMTQARSFIAPHEEG